MTIVRAAAKYKIAMSVLGISSTGAFDSCCHAGCHSFTPPAEVAGLLQGMADSLCHNTDSGWTSHNVFHVAPGRELD